MAHLRGARASFLCVTETESMATVCQSSHSPTSGGHLHAFDKRSAPDTRVTCVKNVLGRVRVVVGRECPHVGCKSTARGAAADSSNETRRCSC